MKKYRSSIKDIIVIILCLAWIVLCSGSVGSNGVRFARRAVCMVNMKRLTHAWIACAQDNDGYIPSGIPGLGTRPWLGTFGSRDIIEDGSLWPYCRDYSLYRCPNGSPSERITYAAVASIIGSGVFVPGNRDIIIQKLSDVPEEISSRRMVFIDTGRLTPDTFAVYYNQESWWDPPPIRHELGTCASFVDGHSVYKKWKGIDTIQFGRSHSGLHTQVPVSYDGFQDLYWMQNAIWGKLGYSPSHP